MSIFIEFILSYFAGIFSAELDNILNVQQIKLVIVDFQYTNDDFCIDRDNRNILVKIYTLRYTLFVIII